MPTYQFKELWAEIDQYCERTSHGLFSEPLNLISNLAFIIAAILLWRRYNRLFPKHAHPELKWLIGLIFLVGIGSALFHSLAVFWSMWADVIPIIVTLLVFLGIFLKQVVKLDARGSIVGFLAFGAASALFGFGLPAAWFNGSNQYFSTFFALIIMSAYLKKLTSPQASTFALAAWAFAASLLFRSIDLASCEVLPMGTHFLWHSFNSLCLYLVTAGLMGEIARREG